MSRVRSRRAWARRRPAASGRQGPSRGTDHATPSGNASSFAYLARGSPDRAEDSAFGAFRAFVALVLVACTEFLFLFVLVLVLVLVAGTEFVLVLVLVAGTEFVFGLVGGLVFVLLLGARSELVIVVSPPSPGLVSAAGLAGLVGPLGVVVIRREPL